MNQSLRILTASLTTFVVGSYLVYDTIQQNSPAYQSHPAVAVITAFWGASLSGLIYYFGIGWFMRRKVKKQNTGDNKFYDEVASELQNKTLNPGLWTRAFAEANGDDAKARALYIKLRVQQLHDEAQAQVERKKVERRKAERAALPELSGLETFGYMLLAVFCGLMTCVSIFGIIGTIFYQPDLLRDAPLDSADIEAKTVAVLVLCAFAFLCGLAAYKCQNRVRASRR